MRRTAFLAQVTGHVGGDLAVEGAGGNGEIRRVDLAADSERVVIALLRPGDFHDAALVGADQEPDSINLSRGGARALGAGVTTIAAMPQYSGIDHGIQIFHAEAGVQIAQRGSDGQRARQRFGGQEKRARHRLDAIVTTDVSNRLETLQTMAADRANAFANYGLAMEYVNTGALESAVTQFAVLLEHHPNYGAGYFHNGQTLEKLGKVDEARAIYRKGIEVTAATGDHHTRSELQGSLDALG